MCAHRPDYAGYDSLPPWARQTLAEHAGDRRAPLYTARAARGRRRPTSRCGTPPSASCVRDGHDPQLSAHAVGQEDPRVDREPARSPATTLIHLNNKYALDGRDPNSYSGIVWVLGRYDRPWGPERPVYGKIRYMSSDNTARKLHVRDYLATYGV